MPNYQLKPDGGAGEFETIPQGLVLDAELLEVKEKTMPFKDDDGNEIVKVEFSFKVIEEGQWKNRRVWGQTPTTFSMNPSCKLRSWVQELLNVPRLPADFALDTDDLVGLTCRVAIDHRIQKKPDGDITREFVSDVIRGHEREGVAASEIF